MVPAHVRGGNDLRPSTFGLSTFEEGDEIEEGDIRAALFNDNGTCETVAPTSGVFISFTYEEGDTVTSEAVLAKIQTDR